MSLLAIASTAASTDELVPPSPKEGTLRNLRQAFQSWYAHLSATDSERLNFLAGCAALLLIPMAACLIAAAIRRCYYRREVLSVSLI